MTSKWEVGGCLGAGVGRLSNGDRMEICTTRPPTSQWEQGGSRGASSSLPQAGHHVAEHCHSHIVTVRYRTTKEERHQAETMRRSQAGCGRVFGSGFVARKRLARKQHHRKNGDAVARDTKTESGARDFHHICASNAKPTHSRSSLTGAAPAKHTSLPLVNRLEGFHASSPSSPIRSLLLLSPFLSLAQQTPRSGREGSHLTYTIPLYNWRWIIGADTATVH